MLLSYLATARMVAAFVFVWPCFFLSAEQPARGTSPDPAFGETRSGPLLGDALPVEPLPRLEERYKKRPLFIRGFMTLVDDHAEIWTSPTKIGRGSLKWLVPLAGATALSFRFDKPIADSLPNTKDQIAAARKVSFGAHHYTLGGIAASFYAVGRLTGNSRARETGVIAAQALLHTHSVVQALKFATGRERPDYGQGQGRLWQGQQSFPSGHSASSWAIATVISREYHENKWLRYGVYAFPLTINAARMGARRHFLSDSIAGAAIGVLIGRFLYEKHHDPALGGAPIRSHTYVPKPDLSYNPDSRGYTLSLSWEF